MQTKPGFSLIEIMIVVFIIGTLIGMIALFTRGGRERSNMSTARQTLQAIKAAVDNYEMTMGDYPQALEDLINEPTDEKLANKWPGAPFIPKVPKDPWKRAYVYELTPDSEHPYELYSKGPKGKTKVSAWDLD